MNVNIVEPMHEWIPLQRKSAEFTLMTALSQPSIASQDDELDTEHVCPHSQVKPLTKGLKTNRRANIKENDIFKHE